MASHLRRTDDEAGGRAVGHDTRDDATRTPAGSTGVAPMAGDLGAADSIDILAGTAAEVRRGRHARHASSVPGVEHGTSASVTGAFQRLSPSVTGSFAALTDADLRPLSAPAAPDDADDDPVSLDDDASPRPIGVDPAVTGSFSRITPEMAARAVTRETAAGVASAARARRIAEGEAARGAEGAAGSRGRAAAGVAPLGSGAGGTVAAGHAHEGGEAAGARIRPRAMAAVAIVAVAVAVLVGGLLWRAIGSVGAGEAPGTGVATPDEASADGSVVVAGTSYTLVDNGDGTHGLAARSEGAGEAVVVAVINGTPAALIAYNGSVIVPESYADDTWDIIAYTPGGDALAALVVDAEGAPVHGSGAITGAHLDGDTLVVDDTTGATTSVALA